MNSLRTEGVILKRINYAEADRILTLLTKQHGKITVIAKGVRKEKSKLAGGIELMSESDISYIPGKNGMGTLVSTQLVRHFGNIHKDLDRMRLASSFLRKIDQLSEDEMASEYYDTTLEVLLALNTASVSIHLVEAWSTLRLLFLLGEVINLESDSSGNAFSENARYRFSYEDGRFVSEANGDVEPNVIKFMRLLGREVPSNIMAVRDLDALALKSAEILGLAYAYNRPSAQPS